MVTRTNTHATGKGMLSVDLSSEPPDSSPDSSHLCSDALADNLLFWAGSAVQL